ncbi:aldo/keto reductase [Entomomonas asaccharolytica]|uniref:Aldo/keto reductase n=1 Tax=Entomomonas asaccharolytica TaxID=2785331 RepID=A0A974RYA8_9GAMM|nr:aldo/keto reductase [Entomomonas asaccharolytica]QQP87111.1 aldo/keto reductase [Entomomonas asaccharolytica]
MAMKTLHELHRPLGSTGIKVSPIGLGTVKIGRDQGVKYPTQFTIPNDDEVKKLLRTARELGINTLDTAPAYGNSEQRLGELLTDREQWIIVSKAGEEFINGSSSFDFSVAHIISSIERSLKRLQTDYIDVLLIHSDGNDLSIVNNLELWDTLKELKQRGLIRSFGLSGKTVEGGIKALQHSDCAMVTFNLKEQSEKAVLDYAAENNKGIFIKKALASGHVCANTDKSPVEASFDLVFSQPAVSSAIVGTINLHHLKQNVDVAIACLIK